MTGYSESGKAKPPLGKGHRGTIEPGPSVASRRDPVYFVIEDAPQMTPSVAAVLARIVRSLRDHKKREAA